MRLTEQKQHVRTKLQVDTFPKTKCAQLNSAYTRYGLVEKYRSPTTTPRNSAEKPGVRKTGRHQTLALRRETSSPFACSRLLPSPSARARTLPTPSSRSSRRRFSCVNLGMNTIPNYSCLPSIGERNNLGETTGPALRRGELPLFYYAQVVFTQHHRARSLRQTSGTTSSEEVVLLHLTREGTAHAGAVACRGDGAVIYCNKQR